jgi:hypothetical protein
MTENEIIIQGLNSGDLKVEMATDPFRFDVVVNEENNPQESVDNGFLCADIIGVKDEKEENKI